MRGLFIGIGGTGDQILTRLKDRVYATLGEIPDTLQFRLLDTEDEAKRQRSGARLGGKDSALAIAGNEYLQLKDDPPGRFRELTKQLAGRPNTKPELSGWYRADKFNTHLPAADFNLTCGAGQHRQIARMGSFLNKDSVMNMLGAAMDKCSQGLGEGELPIWIVGSVAGGTGAGLFMDVALMARGVSDKKRIRKRIIGAAVLPDVFGELGIDNARAYAVLRELERFQAPVDNGYLGRVGGTDGVRFSVRYDARTVIHLKNKLFDNLVFCNRGCNNAVARENYYSQIADGLNLLLDQAAGNEIHAKWITAREGPAFWPEEVADKDVLATLMAALTIPYQNTAVFETLRAQYVNVQNKDEHELTWREQAYHLFRCDQETWHIERRQALKTGNKDFPEIPGHLARLLDDPKLSKLFGEALVSGVIGQVAPSLRGVRVWACGKADEDNPDRLILLNDPAADNEPQDLLRAFVTFVMDKQDRRPVSTKKLRWTDINTWIDAQLHESGKTLKQMAKEYRAAHPERFEIRLGNDEGAPAIGPDTFLALVLNHYLADLLEAGL